MNAADVAGAVVVMLLVILLFANFTAAAGFVAGADFPGIEAISAATLVATAFF